LEPLTDAFELLIRGPRHLIRGLNLLIYRFHALAELERPLIQRIHALTRLACPLIHLVQPGLQIPQHRPVLFQLALDESGLGRQFLQALMECNARPLALFHGGLDTTAHLRLELSQSLLGEVPRTLVGSIQRRQLAPKRRDIATHRKDLLVGHTPADEKHPRDETDTAPHLQCAPPDV